jgi:hypothetical protein
MCLQCKKRHRGGIVAYDLFDWRGNVHCRGDAGRRIRSFVLAVELQSHQHVVCMKSSEANGPVRSRRSPQAMEIDKRPRHPANPRVTSTCDTNGRDETGLLFADEQEIHSVAHRGVNATSKAVRDLADGQIELIPILPIDEQNARRFPAETTLLSAAPLRVALAQRSGPPVREKLHRSRPATARPRRTFRLARGGAMAVIAGFAIGWVAGRPASQSVPSIRPDAVRPAPVGESPLGTSGLERAGKKPEPAPPTDDRFPKVGTTPAFAANAITTARKEANVSKRSAAASTAELLPTPRPAAAPEVTRSGPAVLAPAPVPLKEMPAPSTSREASVEKPAPPTAVPIRETPTVAPAASTSMASVTDKSAPPPEPVNDAAAVRAALAKYANAYTDLDVAAVRAVWPSVDQAGLKKAFSALDAQQVTFDRCDVQVTGAAGRATCAGSAMWRPKIGGGNAREQNRTWTFVLKNAGGAWQIVTAEAR